MMRICHRPPATIARPLRAARVGPPAVALYLCTVRYGAALSRVGQELQQEWKYRRRRERPHSNGGFTRASLRRQWEALGARRALQGVFDHRARESRRPLQFEV